MPSSSDDVYYYIRPALKHWEVKVGGRSMKEVGGAVLAGSSPPFLGRERAAVDVDVGPERRVRKVGREGGFY